MGYISVRNAHKEFMKDGEPLTILEDINLDIEKGEFICLLGPSGSTRYFECPRPNRCWKYLWTCPCHDQ